jgi:hypothetical protein
VYLVAKSASKIRLTFRELLGEADGNLLHGTQIVEARVQSFG